MNEELNGIIELTEKEDCELKSAKKVFNSAKDKRNKAIRELSNQYFRNLVIELNNGVRYSQLLESDGLFRLLDAKLDRHEEYDLDWGEDRGHWRIGDFEFDGTGPTLFERYPAIIKQLDDLVKINLHDSSLSIQSRFGCHPWRELGKYQNGGKIAGLIRNERVSEYEVKGAIRKGLIDLLTATVDFNTKDDFAGSGTHRFKIIDEKTNEQICPNGEFVQAISTLSKWYRACRELIGDPLAIIVKKNAKKWYKILGTGRDY